MSDDGYSPDAIVFDPDADLPELDAGGEPTAELVYSAADVEELRTEHRLEMQALRAEMADLAARVDMLTGRKVALGTVIGGADGVEVSSRVEGDQVIITAWAVRR